MPSFICEKCGKVDNSACANNYWHARSNKYLKSNGKENKISTSYKSEFAYFEDHVCCSDCCDGIVYYDDSGVISKETGITLGNLKHWSEYGSKENILEWESRNDGSMVNATEYFKSIGEL